MTEREAADAILAQFPGPLRIQVSRVARWAMRVLLVGLLLLLIFFGGTGAAGVFFLVVVPLAFHIFVDSASAFTVDAEGFTVKNKKVHWAEIKVFEAVTPGIRYGDVVYFHVGGGLSTLSYPNIFSPSTIAALMNEWRSRALALAQEKADKSKKILSETASL